MKLQVPVTQPDGSYNDGPIGGFTDGDDKYMIYQCGFKNCGALCKYNTGFNKHRKEAHGLETVSFGWADGPPPWEELDITKEMIVE